VTIFKCCEWNIFKFYYEIQVRNEAYSAVGAWQRSYVYIYARLPDVATTLLNSTVTSTCASVTILCNGTVICGNSSYQITRHFYVEFSPILGTPSHRRFSKLGSLLISWAIRARGNANGIVCPAWKQGQSVIVQAVSSTTFPHVQNMYLKRSFTLPILYRLSEFQRGIANDEPPKE